MRKSLILAILLSTSFGGAAIAEERKGFYLTAGTGTNIFLDAD